MRSRPDWAPGLLARLAETGNISAACLLVGIDRKTFYKRRDAEPAFAEAVAEALDAACDTLELEARRRAAEGLVRKKFTKAGDPIIDPETKRQYVEREYSDTLLIFLLKAHRPEKFRENVRHEHAGKVEVDVSHLSDAELARIAADASDAPGPGGP